MLRNQMVCGVVAVLCLWGVGLRGTSFASDLGVTPGKMTAPKNIKAGGKERLTAKPVTNKPVALPVIPQRETVPTLPQPDLPGVEVPKPTEICAAEKLLVQINSTTVPPEIDGVLDDPAWKSAAVLSGFSSTNGGPAAYATTGQVLFDRVGLYVSLLCNDEPATVLTDKDTVEIQLSKAPEGLVYSLTISAAGDISLAKVAADGTRSVWTGAGIRFVTGRQERAGLVELAIPFAAIDLKPPATKLPLYLRVNRVKATGTAETSYWSANASGYNIDKGLGECLLLP